MPELSTWETLYLWHLIGRGGAAEWRDRPASSIEARHRKALERHGLIEVTKGRRGALSAEVTDAGWAWAADNLQSALPPSKGASPVLLDWLSALGRYLGAHRLGLADLFVAPPEPEPVSAEGSLEHRIRERYLNLTGGRWREEVRLADIKAAFPSDKHQAIDSALMSLAKTGAAELLPIDDPSRLEPRDESSALRIAGEIRHLVFLQP